MDIEGSGSHTHQAQSDPAQPSVLAVCAYHRQDHLWRIPSLDQLGVVSIASSCGRILEVWDLVCYAIPAGRLNHAVNSPNSIPNRRTASNLRRLRWLERRAVPATFTDVEWR
jgi:hypothetical protein